MSNIKIVIRLVILISTQKWFLSLTWVYLSGIVPKLNSRPNFDRNFNFTLAKCLLKEHIHKIWSDYTRCEHFLAFSSNVQIINYRIFLFSHHICKLWSSLYYFLSICTCSECLMEIDIIPSIEQNRINIYEIYNFTCLWKKNSFIFPLKFWVFMGIPHFIF